MSLHLNAAIPSLEGATQWINGEPDLDSVRGEPVLIYFWAVSCHVCHENMSKLQSWREEYVPKGLKMVAIHCPRMKTDTNIDKVKAAVKNYGIVEPCAVDNMHKIKKAFDNEIWPAYFLFDKNGKLKRRTAGNNGIAMLMPILNNMLT
jgi:thiol-disulfide isomerase/thioredoxin